MGETIQSIRKSGGGGSEETYSESEIEIGTFLGKPLYRKTWSVNIGLPGMSDNPNYKTYSVGTINGCVIKVDAIIDNGNTKYNTGCGAGSCFYDNDTLYIRQLVTGNANTHYAKALVLEYTKETW